MAAITYPELMPVTVAPTVSAASVLTNPSTGITYILSCIVIHNTSTTTARVVTMYKVPNTSGAAGTASTSNEIWKVSVAVGDTVFLEPAAPWILAAQGDSMQALADGSGVNIQILGAQYS